MKKCACLPSVWEVTGKKHWLGKGAFKLFILDTGLLTRFLLENFPDSIYPSHYPQSNFSKINKLNKYWWRQSAVL
jgi:hypothetical protein